MEGDSRLYIAGLQTAILRGDLPLLRTCFEWLWEHNRQALKEEIILITARCAWYQAGELIPLFSGKPERGIVQAFLARLCVTTPNRDALALRFLVENGYSPEKELMEPFAEAYQLLKDRSSGYVATADKLLVSRFKKLSKYEQEAGQLLRVSINSRLVESISYPDRFRACQEDILTCLSAMLLITRKRIKVKALRYYLERTIEEYIRDHPTTGIRPILPWYLKHQKIKEQLEQWRNSRKQKKILGDNDPTHLWFVHSIYHAESIGESPWPETWWPILEARFGDAEAWEKAEAALRKSLS